MKKLIRRLHKEIRKAHGTKRELVLTKSEKRLEDLFAQYRHECVAYERTWNEIRARYLKGESLA